MPLNEIQYVQLGLTAMSGIFGVGVGAAWVKFTLKSVLQDVEGIKIAQAKLRGNGGNTPPLFMRRGECIDFRSDCDAKKDINNIVDVLSEHTKSIKTFEKFARWRMQQDGLTQQQINEILRSD